MLGMRGGKGDFTCLRWHESDQVEKLSDLSHCVKGWLSFSTLKSDMWAFSNVWCSPCVHNKCTSGGPTCDIMLQRKCHANAARRMPTRWTEKMDWHCQQEVCQKLLLVCTCLHFCAGKREFKWATIRATYYIHTWSFISCYFIAKTWLLTAECVE